MDTTKSKSIIQYRFVRCIIEAAAKEAQFTKHGAMRYGIS